MLQLQPLEELQRLSSASLDRPAPVESVAAFDLREALSFLWRQWKFITAIASVIVVIAAVYVLKQTPLYTANALVLLDPQKDRIPNAETNNLSGTLLDDAIVENQIAIIRSSTFLRRVVEKISLVSDPEFGHKTTSESDAVQHPNSGGADTGGIPPDVVATIEALSGAITVTRAGLGYILSVSVTSMDRARAARLTNAVADAFVVEKLDARFEAAKRASAWLSDRLVELRQQLRQSEEAVAQFRAEHGLVRAAGNLTLNQQQVSDLNAKLVEARADVAQRKSRVDMVRSIEEKGGNIQSLPDLPASQQLTALRGQETATMQRVSQLSTRYTDRHPLVVNAQAELRDIRREIATEMQRVGANVRNEYELAKARADALERALLEATGQSNIDDKTAITLRELERTAAVNKSLFEDFLQKSKITQEQSTFEARDARVVTPALPPGAASSPRTFRTLAVALALGLLLGVGGAVAKEMLNAGFTTARQVEGMLQLPLLASVKSMASNETIVQGKIVRIPLYVAAAPLSRFSEAIRSLRTGIQMTDVDDPPKLIQVTSTVPGEGKTTIALSLAISAATSGLTVLFVDADLRHPSASRFLGLQKHHGLVDLLVDDGEFQNVIRFHETAKFWALAAGSKTSSPADLLGSDHMKSFLADCKRKFDLVVIDSPPTGPVIDPIVIAQHVDKVIFVVRWAATPRELVEHSIQRIPGQRKVAGIVFNQVNEKLAQKYGKDAYSYYYGARDYRKYYSG